MVIVTDLPEEIVEDILSFLPVKSLMRFRSVCKGWYNLLRNQDFISKHHNNQIDRSHFNVIVRHGKKDEKCLSILSANGSGGDDMLGAVETCSLLLPESFPESVVPPICISVPVNGLLYLYNRYDRFALWNPATGELKTLPSSPFRSMRRYIYSQAFGFDSETNDYKILWFAKSYVRGAEKLEISNHQVELYSLKNDSWKEVHFSHHNVYVPRSGCCQAYNNGVHYWVVAFKDLGYCEFILCFNFSDEVFEQLFLPNFGFFADDVDLMVFNGMLSAIVSSDDFLEPMYDIWVLKEHKYGVSESWEKQQRIVLVQGIERPLGFWKNRMFFVNEESKLVLYDPITRQVRNLQLYGENRTWRVVNYVESLVPLNGG